MSVNKLVIASAGSGKTTFLVKEALKLATEKILITTFTIANKNEIRKKIIKQNKFIPENITIQTWFSFLLEHGVKPFQGCLYDKQIKGMILVNSQSALFIPENKIESHYFTKEQKIYSDKIAKFTLKCNEISSGAVINRLERIYTHIFIDEVQDLSCYDLDLLKLFINSKSNLLLVGDPRQGTYSTSNSKRNNKFKKSAIVNFFDDKEIKIDTDDTLLTTNFRSISAICELSNKLYPLLKKASAGNTKKTIHDGVFLVCKKDTIAYLEKFHPVQLRFDIRTKTNENYPVMNYGDSKGLEFERVLIYPTEPIIKWLKNNLSDLAPTSRSKFYVALTRAFFSVGIIYDYDLDTQIPGTYKYKN